MELDLENPLPPSNETFPSLFKMESDHMPSMAYSQDLASRQGSNLSVRRAIVGSISDFSRKFDPFLTYLAINYADRYLSTRSIPDRQPWIFRLVAIACVSLALKMRKTGFSISDLMQDEGFMFDSTLIQRMEMLILGALKWRMRSTNPFCFVNYFISFFKFNDKPSVQELKNRAKDIIFKAQNDVKLLKFKPSIISATALLCAVSDLFPIQFPSFRNAICSCSYVEKEDFLRCYEEMQDVATEGYEPLWALSAESCGRANGPNVNALGPKISGLQNMKTGDRDNEGGDN